MAEIPPGYPYQSITAPFGSPYPYLLQPAAAADADGLAPDVPLPAEASELSDAADVKAVRLLSPAADELRQTSEDERPVEDGAVLKEEPGLEDSKQVLSQACLGPPHAHLALPPIISQGHHVVPEQESHSTGKVLHTEEQEEQDEGKLQELSVQTCHALQQASALVSETSPEVEAGEGTSCASDGVVDTPAQYSEPQAEILSVQQPEEETLSPPVEVDLEPLEATELLVERSDETEPVCQTQPVAPLAQDGLPPLGPVHIQPEDPMAGMMALVTASELPQACSLLALPGTLSADPRRSAGILPLEAAALEGIALLSEIAELELQRRCNEMQCMFPREGFKSQADQ